MKYTTDSASSGVLRTTATARGQEATNKESHKGQAEQTTKRSSQLQTYQGFSGMYKPPQAL